MAKGEGRRVNGERLMANGERDADSPAPLSFSPKSKPAISEEIW